MNIGGEQTRNIYFDFSDYKVVSINKGNFYQYLTNNNSYEEILKDGKAIYKPVFKNSNLDYFEYMIQKDVLSGMKDGQSVIVIVCDSVAFYNNQIMSKIVADDYVYSKIPVMFLIFSYISNRSLMYFDKELGISRMEKSGAWSLVKFTKTKK